MFIKKVSTVLRTYAVNETRYPLTSGLIQEFVQTINATDGALEL